MKKNNTSAQLLPKSHTARRYIGKFGHPHKFLEAENPYVSQETGKRKKGFGKQKPETNWRRENNYQLRPRTLWRRHQDPKDLIGVCFGEFTHYVVLDIDITGNPYHPDHDEGAFRNLLGILEDIGLVRPIVIRSSWSGGLHVFYFFKEAVKSFDIACAMQEILKEAGIRVTSGKVELFPNAKSYGKYYNAHRLPLQPMTGAIILDDNFEPLTDDVEKFLNMADRTAAFQDMDKIKEACDRYGKLIRLERCSRGKGSLKKFENDLLDEFGEGFTAAGQTNHLLLTIGCYGVVFMGLDEDGGIEPLVEYLVETITGLDGYEEHCNHQHEIERRAQEVAKSSQAFYWAVGKDRKRQRTFKDNFGEIISGVVNGNQAKAIKALQRLQVLLDHLKESGEEIPTTMKAFKLLLIAKSKTIFGEGFSPVTLGKPQYRNKWHPVFTALVAAQVALAQPAEAIAPIVDSEPKTIELVSGVTQEGVKSTLKTTSKTAETRTKQQGYTPCTKVSEVKPPEPAQNKEGTHLALYEGFGKGAAPSSKNLSLFPSSTTRTSQPISPANQSQLQKPRPILKSEHKQRLSVAAQRQHDQLQALIAAQNRLEDERTTPEYRRVAKNAFDRIRAILGRYENNSTRGTPSPPS